MSFPIEIRTLTGKSYIIPNITSKTTVRTITARFAKKIGDSDDSLPLRIIFAGKTLDPDKDLSYYNITGPATFHNVSRLRGGGLEPLTFSSLKEKKLIEFDYNAPNWRRVCAGLNLSGECRNPKCLAYKEIVWVQKGFGTFNMNKEARICECPQCNKPLEQDCEIPGFWDCIYSIEGIFKNTMGKKEQVNEGPFVAPKDRFTTYSKKDVAPWLYLTIVVKKT